jgi:hypothetical protein
MTKRLGYTYAERPIIPSTPLPLRILRGKDKRPLKLTPATFIRPD